MATESTALIRVEDGQIVAGEELRLALDTLREKAKGIIVRDKLSSTEAKELVKVGKDEIKHIIAIAEPERLRLQGLLETLRGQRDKMTQQFSDIIAPLERAARDFDIAEQEAAKKEQDKLNKGKKAEDRVTVKPDVRSVPGTRFQVRYRVEIIDASKVKRQWLAPDEQAIGKKAREDKDPEKTMREVGGIRVTKE